MFEELYILNELYYLKFKTVYLLFEVGGGGNQDTLFESMAIF